MWTQSLIVVLLDGTAKFLNPSFSENANESPSIIIISAKASITFSGPNLPATSAQLMLSSSSVVA